MDQQEKQRHWVSIDELLGEVPGLSRGTLATWRYRGIGPKFYKIGKAIWYDLDEVHAAIEASGRQSTAEAS